MSSSAGGSSYSGTTNAGRKALLDRKKDQGFTVYWNQVFRPALIETMVAVNKEVENDILVLFECLVEFLQSIAFAFIYNTWWGTSGNMFGRVVAYSEIASVLEYEIHSVEPYYALVTAIFLLVAMLLGSFAYVVMSFITRNFKAGVWPLRILRTLGKKNIILHALEGINSS
ncbi:hypothetical protein HK098_007489 [Nowakowskiella sp. JEL0407]|nr:hypothetical protein HK098_007489 [Nowakowskiella sp. JEL0407]